MTGSFILESLTRFKADLYPACNAFCLFQFERSDSCSIQNFQNLQYVTQTNAKLQTKPHCHPLKIYAKLSTQALIIESIWDLFPKTKLTLQQTISHLHGQTTLRSYPRCPMIANEATKKK